MIFVTGGTGFLGRHLVPALCQAGFRVRVLTRQPDENSWLRRYPRVDIIKGDLLHPETFIPALEGCRYVIHAGGVFRFWGDEQVFFDTNARGTEHLASAAAAAGIERFIHISTVAVVGQPDTSHIIDENYPPQPAD